MNYKQQRISDKNEFDDKRTRSVTQACSNTQSLNKEDSSTKENNYNPLTKIDLQENSECFVENLNKSNHQDVLNPEEKLKNKMPSYKIDDISVDSDKLIAASSLILSENVQSLSTKNIQIMSRLPIESTNSKSRHDLLHNFSSYSNDNCGAFKSSKLRDKSVGIDIDKSKYINKIICKESRNEISNLVNKKGFSIEI